eukprot:4591647-Alexandrium_andersonii.AAC.1
MEHITNTDDRAGGYAGLLERAAHFDEQPVVGPTPFRCCNPTVEHRSVQVGEPAVGRTREEHQAA